MVADNPNLKIPDPPDTKFNLHVQISTPTHPAWQWHLYSQHPTFQAARQAFDNLDTETHTIAQIENSSTGEVGYITKRKSKMPHIKDLTENEKDQMNPKKRYVSDDKIILNLQGLRFATKEDMIYSIKDKTIYRIRWDYKGSSGYTDYKEKEERDRMFDKISEAIRQWKIKWKIYRKKILNL